MAEASSALQGITHAKSPRYGERVLETHNEFTPESGEYFRQIADNLPLILVLSNADISRFLFVNRAYEKIWGRSVESVYQESLSFLEGVHPDDRERFREALEGLKRGEQIEGLECRVIRPDGSTCWVLCRGFPVRDAAGQIIRLVGSAQDITESKRGEIALRASEDRYRDLVEHSCDLICTHDEQGILLSVNETPLKILGYSRDELLNKPLRDFVTPEARAVCDAYLAQVQKDGFAKGLLPVLTKNGEVRLWEYHNTVRRDGVNAPIVRGIAHDVTEQKRVEAALRRSEEKFSKVFRSSPVEMIISTLEDGRFLEVNETFERNIGYTREEALGRTVLEMGLWADPAQRAAMIEDVKKSGRVANREIQIRTKSGEIAHKLYSAEILRIGKEQCLLAVSEDITEQKRAQENLRRSESFLAAGQRLSQTGSWAWNPDSGELFWSQETFHILGIDPAAKPSKELLIERLHPEDRPIFRVTLEQMVREKRDMEMDYRVVVPPGIVKHIHIVARPVFTPAADFLEFVGTAMDVTDRRKTEEELRRLSGQLLRLHDEERRSIARDLHDSTGQGLVALTATLGQLHSSIPSSNRKSRKLLAESEALAKECLREIRTLSYVLYPPMLEQAGLVDAVRHFRDGFVDRTGIQVNLRISPHFGRLARETELALFRVLQESLANIQRHSGCSQVEIVLDQEAGRVLLEVKDNGQSNCVNAGKSNGEIPFRIGVGIASMQERVNQVAGRLEIRSNSAGTTVLVAVPVHG